MNLNESNSLSLEYKRYTSSACKDIDIRKFEFVTKTQFLLNGKLSTIANFADCYIYILSVLRTLEL